MQQLYLSDLGNTKPNVAPDVTTSSPDVQSEANKGESTQTLSSEKGESAAANEQFVPNTPSDEGEDDDAQKIQIAQEALNSLVESISGAKGVPDASASLAQDQPQETTNDVVDDTVPQTNDCVADPHTQQDENVTDKMDTDNAMSEHLEHVTIAEEEGATNDDSTEDDLTIMKIVGESRRKAGKTGVGSRLRTRKEKETENVAEGTKSTKKKKNVAAEATKTPKKKKVAAEATTST
ncbi:hypothetical protein QL285_021981 [Trifolium repens]|nr:hypothetical protein QL285_021981 [Trifolium repens]